MSGVWDEIEFTKELTRRRITKDEEDVQSMINTTTEEMVNSILKIQRKIQCLISILAWYRPRCCKILPTAKEQGQKATNDIIDHNLASDKKSFWAPITKMKLKTFTSLSELLKSEKSKEKQIVINADRQLWNRLTIVSKIRDIDFKDVLSYELSSVPLSLSTLDGSLRKPNKTVSSTISR